MRRLQILGAISLALVGPPAIGAVLAELHYHFKWKSALPSIVAVVLSEVVALSLLFWAVNWKLWVKCLVALPFLIGSLATTSYLVLLVASANGETMP
jgi:hypothetical protein